MQTTHLLCFLVKSWKIKKKKIKKKKINKSDLRTYFFFRCNRKHTYFFFWPKEILCVCVSQKFLSNPACAINWLHKTAPDLTVSYHQQCPKIVIDAKRVDYIAECYIDKVKATKLKFVQEKEPIMR